VDGMNEEPSTPYEVYNDGCGWRWKTSGGCGCSSSGGPHTFRFMAVLAAKRFLRKWGC